MAPNFDLEIAAGGKSGRCVVGIDEAGRGPWAGPVVAAAVHIDIDRAPESLLAQLDDSKRLSAALRRRLFQEMTASSAVITALGQASVAEIDRLNILQASLLAMARAAAALPLQPDRALVDGRQVPALACPAEAVVKGDGRSLSIAAASICAKVTRDGLMAALAERHPGYGWARNQGYGTREHRDGLARLGVTPHHRRSFAPIRAALESARG
ncbi:MAG TPA: ribonuclease HII [Kiloniellaceae bacterium]|nr:ribonuclease HII [Kiloniellaceae bacterium]